MDFAGAFFNGILTIIGYVVIFFGVYKVYQVASDIREIKELLVNGRRNLLPAASLVPASAPGLAPEIAKDLLAEDAATAYAQSLLRAVNPEARAVQQTQEVR
ncbi:MAG: hypothetical protein M3O20_03265 [Acidobacteriota bacterium]|nr:hypothetical protein [Acidobacteriota bacterium]